MHSISNNIEILMVCETGNINDELFESLLQRYQKPKEESRKRGSEFIHKYVDLLYYNLHKISLRKVKSYVKSPEWLENERAAINPKDKKGDKCFHYALTLALNHKTLNQQRISKIKLFIGRYNWKDVPSYLKDWTKLE